MEVLSFLRCINFHLIKHVQSSTCMQGLQRLRLEYVMGMSGGIWWQKRQADVKEHKCR